MSDYHLISRNKTLPHGETKIQTTCFGELHIGINNFGSTNLEAQILDGTDYLTLAIKSSTDFGLNFHFPSSLISLVIPISKGPKINIQQVGKDFIFSARQFNFSTSKDFEFSCSEPFEIHFLITKKYHFLQILNPVLKSHQEIISRLNSDGNWLLSENEKFYFREQKPISDLFYKEKDNPLGFLLFQSKILEFYAALFNVLEKNSTKNSDENCTWTRLKPLIEAKRIIEDNLANPPSLSELSKRVGINEFDLKKGFKEQFGHTVFGYLGEQRMALALDLLKANSQTIAEVSSIVGYKNPQHFSSAFKKKFGQKPSEINRSSS